MEDYTEDFSSELERDDYIEEDEPVPEPEAPEGPSGPEPEPVASGEGPSGPGAESPEEPEPEELPGEPGPETPPSEEDGSQMQDLIDAIGDLNETITGAVTEEQEGPEDSEDLSPGGEGAVPEGA